MKKYTKRDAFCFAVGVPCVALGTALFVKAALGISVMSAMPYVLSGKLTFFSYGVWNYIMQGVVMLAMVLFLRRMQFSYLLSFGVSVMNGYLTDFFGWCLSFIPAETPIARLIFFCLAIAVQGFGIGGCLMTRLPIAPFDIIVREIVTYKHKTARVVKLTVDLCCLTASCVFSLLLYGNLSGIGAATVFLGLFNGYNVGFWKKQWQKLCDGVSWLR